ncbi:TPA: hypothetical protein ACGCEE_002985 [Stenotrophomonas maltophilia]|uniref:hypothetical protein n=1 Tax=Stenotrophomonas maltophilia TaxID=40324 RepID=UPI0021CA8D6C|nr:hypothetical protein [Stenotrophomonas maltophilia]MCU1023735.1 hypothetical protein [Stenotrophomonas maltophilia]MDH1129909.1 hypothetical protein [Stenotrophomonas maltophilia]HEL7889972.1 hypothetical protein [Stenotrophomonas maltophilia]
MTADIRLNALVVCEEVRREVDGRCTMIGVWPDNVIFLDSETGGKHEFNSLNLYFQFSGKAGLLPIQVHVRLKDDGYAPFELGKAAFHDDVNVVNVRLKTFPTLGFGRHDVEIMVGSAAFKTWFDVARREESLS